MSWFSGVVEKIMAKEFQKIMKGIKSQIQEAQRTDRQVEEKPKPNPTQLIFRLLKNQRLSANMGSREKRHIIYRGAKVRMTEFSDEATQSRRLWSSIFKVLNEKLPTQHPILSNAVF